jgi:hypothetical protein
MSKRGFADFEVPKSTIPLFAGRESFLEEKAQLWPDLAQKQLERNAPTAIVYDKKNSLQRDSLITDLQKIKARDGVMPASFPGPDYEALYSKAAGVKYAYPRNSHESIMQWHVANYPNLRPTGRADVFKLETWLKHEIEDTTRVVLELEHKLGRDSAQVEWTMEQHQEGVNWGLQGYGWKAWLRQMIQFQEIYAQVSNQSTFSEHSVNIQ